MNKEKQANKQELRLKGLSISAGIAIGTVYIHKETKTDIKNDKIKNKDIETEIGLFRKSIKMVLLSLRANYEKTKNEYGESFAEIFLGQIAILEDQIFLTEVEEDIQKKRHTAEASTYKIFSRKRKFFLNIENEYFKDRAFDIYDLKNQIIAALRGDNRSYTLSKPSIIVGVSITPSDTVHYKRDKIMGFITELGGKTSHTSILAHSLNIPSITGIKNITSLFTSAQDVILDGKNGIVIINPTEASKAEYRLKRDRYENYIDALREYRDINTVLKDNTKISLSANIEFIEDIESMKRFGLKNVGLYRSEGYFLQHNELPNEDTQYVEYTRLKNELQGSEIIIRTLDIGGDKLHDKLSLSNEENPFLGWRAIRLCLDEIELFKTHLTAILRASYKSNFKILLPMLTDLSELLETRSIISKLIKDLTAEGKKIKSDIEVGIMIETPASAYFLENLIEHVDFVSIGTNDLIQYTLAVDRGNEKVSYLYQCMHPAVLQLIKHVITVANEHNKMVSMCGEMAADPKAFPVLIGMGLRHFSMTSRKSLEIKRILGEITCEECEKLLTEIRCINTYIGINEYVSHWFNAKFSDLDLLL